MTRRLASGEPPSDVLPLPQAAEELGVHYMTAYRYVRLGWLAAERRGGRWLVPRAALRSVSERLERQSDRPAPGRPRPARYRERLLHLLLIGDEAGAWRLAETALAHGMEPAELYVRVLGPCLRKIGDGWRAGTLPVADEHRASTVATRLVGRLGPRFARPGPPRATVVVAGAPGDIHQLPAALVRDVVRGARYRVIDLGGNAPADQLAAVVAQTAAVRAVCLSAATGRNEPRVRAAVQASRRARPDVPVLAGGPAVPDEETARALGGDGWAPDALQLVRLLDELAR